MLTRSALDLYKAFFKKSPASELTMLSLADSRKRQALSKIWNASGLQGKQRQAVKRAIENVVREPKTYNSDRRKLSQDDLLLLLRQYRPSRILDNLYPDRMKPGKWLPLRERNPENVIEIDLTDFSFLQNPKGALASLEEISRAESLCMQAKINFKDKQCIDVTPFMLLVECWGEMAPVFDGGEMDLPMQKVLSAIGIEHALGVSFAGISEYSNVWAFPLTRRRKAGDTRSRNPFADVPTRDIAADRFCDAIDEWLGRPEIKLELTERGLAWIKGMLGELLENAERHSDGDRRDGSWSVSGFLVRSEVEGGEEAIYRACIGIVSVGDTFSESLDRALPEQRRIIQAYIDQVRARGATQSDETLRTLAALQDGVTCVGEADLADRGGYGIMEILDLVSMLGETSDMSGRPEVSIISGRSCVMLRSPYDRGHRRPEDPSSPRVQWFNNENSATLPPDEQHVFDLERYMPGTAVSISFTLDPSYLRRVFQND